MSINVMTEVGAGLINNSISGRYVMKVVGVRVATGGAQPSAPGQYGTPTNYKEAIKSPGLKNPENGNVYPATGYFPIASEFPSIVESGDNDDTVSTVSMQYDFIVDSALIGTDIEIVEMGLFAQNYSIPLTYSSEVSYNLNESVQFNSAFYNCLQGFPSDWDISTSYSIGGLVWYFDHIYRALTANSASVPSSVNSDWEVVNSQPDTATDYWLDVTSQVDRIGGDSGLDPYVRIGDPVLYYLSVRNDYPIPVANTHSISWSLRVGMTLDQFQTMETSWNFGDAVTTTVTELNTILALVERDRDMRDQQVEIEIIKNQLSIN